MKPKGYLSTSFWINSEHISNLVLTQFEEVTHRQTNINLIIIHESSSLIDQITCEETWPMFFSSMKREQCHRLDSSLSVRFPQVHWKWDFWFLEFHSKCHNFSLISEGSDSAFLECDLDVTKLPLYVFIYSFLAGIHFLGLCSYCLIWLQIFSHQRQFCKTLKLWIHHCTFEMPTRLFVFSSISVCSTTLM